jgi:hypothetical protein
MLRGTIAESKPGEFVTIVLITGEARKIPAAEIAYSGAASGPVPPPALEARVPAASPPNVDDTRRPLVTVQGPEAKVQFESTPSGITLHRRSASAGIAGGRGEALISGYDEICTAPCRVALPAGTYTFAASEPKGRAVEADPLTLPAGESVLHGTYQSHSKERVLGVVLIVAGAVTGAALAIHSMASGPETCVGGYCSKQGNQTELTVSLVIVGAGGLAGFLLMRTRDKVEFTVGPGAGAARMLGGRAGESALGAAPHELPGLHVGLVF